MKIMAVLEALEDLENKMAILYGGFSKRYADDAEARDLFSFMSVEEEGHRNLVRYERRVITSNLQHDSDFELPRRGHERRVVSDSLQRFEKIDFDIGVITSAVKEVDRLMASSGQLTLAEALAFSLNIEKGAAEHYNNYLMGHVDEGFLKLVRQLTAGYNEHYRRLSKFAKARGVRGLEQTAC